MARRISRRQLLRSCESIGEEDGSDPKEFFRKPAPHTRGRKVLQLCRQVAEALHWVLGADCKDEVLRSLEIVSVIPAPDSSRLLVTCAIQAIAENVDAETAFLHLHNARGLLRSAMASAIHRKRTPELAFRVVER